MEEMSNQKFSKRLFDWCKKAVKAIAVLAVATLFISVCFSSCGYSFQDIESSFDDGYEEGYEDGFSEGHSEGYDEGYTDGYAAGRKINVPVLSDYERSFQLVARFAGASDMSVKDYCRYCIKQQYMADGNSEADAAQKAEEQFPDQFGEMESAYAVVTIMAQRSEMSISEYIDWCEGQDLEVIP